MSEIYNRMLAYVGKNPDDTMAVLSNPDPKDKPAQDHAWEMWQAYFERTGNKKVLKSWRSHLLTGGKGLTLPCANPDHFDRAYAAQRSPRNRYGYD
jgi:hypothetical protein